MNVKWIEMTKAQKVWFVITCVMLAAALVMLVLDLTGTWQNQIYLYLTAVYLMVEGVMNWKQRRWTAITDLVIGVVFALSAIFFK